MIDPEGMNLLDWADSVILELGTPDGIGRLDSWQDWQEWAAGLVRASPFTQRSLPDPYAFTDWRDWAMLAYPMLEGAV